jgi:thiamine biosynthesis protein ThiS
MIGETRCQMPEPGIRVLFNGESREIPPGQTIAGLLEALGLEPARVAVELDGIIVGRPEWPSRALQAGARLEVVHFVGGG